MKYLILSMSFFCFSTLANVICKDSSNVGDDATEATDIIQECRPSATASPLSAADRDVNTFTTVQVFGGVATYDVSTQTSGSDDSGDDDGSSGDSEDGEDSSSGGSEGIQ